MRKMVPEQVAYWVNAGHKDFSKKGFDGVDHNRYGPDELAQLGCPLIELED